MAYASWSVVFGEQPSAAKWNILGANDASFNDGTGLGDGTVTSEKLDATIACRVYRNAAFSTTGGGGAELLPFDTENFDLGSDFSTGTSLFTAPVTGYYQVNSSTNWTDVNIDTAVAISIYVNGAAYSQAVGYAPASTSDVSVSISDIVPVTAGQTIALWVDSTGNEPIIPGSVTAYMSIYFVGV